MQLLHVFQEDFILNKHENRLSEKNAVLPDTGKIRYMFSKSSPQ